MHETRVYVKIYRLEKTIKPENTFPDAYQMSVVRVVCQGDRYVAYIMKVPVEEPVDRQDTGLHQVAQRVNTAHLVQLQGLSVTLNTRNTLMLFALNSWKQA